MAKKSVLSNDDGFKHGYDFIDRLNDGFIQKEKIKENELGLKEIPLKKIRIKENVRKNYENITEMANSIKEKGIIQPITVVQSDDGFFDILFGHRRYKGYCFLNKQEPEKYLKIQAIVKEKKFFNEDEIKEVQIIENIQRENLKPLEIKESLEYFKNKGMTYREIAEKLGKKEGYVKNIFMIFKAINENKGLKKIMNGHSGVTLADVQVVQTLPAKEQNKIILEKAKGKIKTRSELQQKVSSIKNHSSGHSGVTSKKSKKENKTELKNWHSGVTSQTHDYLKKQTTLDKQTAIFFNYIYDLKKLNNNEKADIINYAQSLISFLQDKIKTDD